MQAFRHHKNQNRRGAVLPMVAILMTVLLGCVAFSVDIAYIQLVKLELKSSVDAAARAGGEALSRQQNLADAKACRKSFGTRECRRAGPTHLWKTTTLFQDTQRCPLKRGSGISRPMPRLTTAFVSSDVGPIPRLRETSRYSLERSLVGMILKFQAQSTVVRIDRDIISSRRPLEFNEARHQSPHGQHVHERLEISFSSPVGQSLGRFGSRSLQNSFPLCRKLHKWNGLVSFRMQVTTVASESAIQKRASTSI